MDDPRMNNSDEFNSQQDTSQKGNSGAAENQSEINTDVGGGQPPPKKPPKAPKTKQTAKKDSYGFFKKKKSGVPLTKEEVRQIKDARKKLRKDLRAVGEKSRKEFDITASSLGLYFDKNKYASLLKWFFATKAAWVLLASAILLLIALFSISLISQMKGHFTVNMSKDLFEQGFALSDSPDFSSSSSHLFATPAADIACMSIVDIPPNVDSFDGEHNGDNFFAYSFYIKNMGDNHASCAWNLSITSESMSLSKAAWILIFIDGQLSIFAAPDDNGLPQTLPPPDSPFAYPDLQIFDSLKNPSQINLLSSSPVPLFNISPIPFLSPSVIASDSFVDLPPDHSKKFTIVVWLEGNDPDASSDLIGSHLGLELSFSAID